MAPKCSTFSTQMARVGTWNRGGGNTGTPPPLFRKKKALIPKKETKASASG